MRKKIGRTRKPPVKKDRKLDFRLYTPRGLRPNERYKLFKQVVDVLKEGERMSILSNGKIVEDEQGFLMHMLIDSKRRWIKDDDQFIKWMEAFYVWLGVEIQLAKTGEKQELRPSYISIKFHETSAHLMVDEHPPESDWYICGNDAGDEAVAHYTANEDRWSQNGEVIEGVTRWRDREPKD
ncbi:hypothetical protein LCGC14_0642070 [marine sediment metagenome]|uniref:Uncharacterized protein n=1 Tax=marine sediment metagenome TaxID=412755 RepID=A0A0F9QYV7_9ZZZZ